MSRGSHSLLDTQQRFLIVVATSHFFIRSSIKSRLAKQVADSLGRKCFYRKTGETIYWTLVQWEKPR